MEIPSLEHRVLLLLTSSPPTHPSTPITPKALSCASYDLSCFFATLRRRTRKITPLQGIRAGPMGLLPEMTNSCPLGKRAVAVGPWEACNL